MAEMFRVDLAGTMPPPGFGKVRRVNQTTNERQETCKSRTKLRRTIYNFTEVVSRLRRYQRVAEKGAEAAQAENMSQSLSMGRVRKLYLLYNQPVKKYSCHSRPECAKTVAGTDS